MWLSIVSSPDPLHALRGCTTQVRGSLPELKCTSYLCLTLGPNNI